MQQVELVSLGEDSADTALGAHSADPFTLGGQRYVNARSGIPSYLFMISGICSVRLVASHP